MFETQKVRRHDKFRKEWSQHQNKCKSQITYLTLHPMTTVTTAADEDSNAKITTSHTEASENNVKDTDKCSL